MDHSTNVTTDPLTSVRRKLWAWAELLRLSNLPTCLSNVLVGAALGSQQSALSWPAVVGHGVGISAFYLAGMALNDYIDSGHDKRSRSQRPIPSGRVGRGETLAIVVILFLLGLGLYGVFFPQVFWMAGLLVLLIILYDVLHKNWSGSVLLMGGCRSMIYLIIGFAGAIDNVDSQSMTIIALFSVILGIYIVSLTAIARIEDKSIMDYRKWLAAAIPILILAAAIYKPPAFIWTALPVGTVLLYWFGRAAMLLWQPSPQTGKAVGYWLAGICLVDTYFLVLLNRPGLAAVTGLFFVITLIGHRRIAGT